MARTRITARKSTGGYRRRIAPPAPVQLAPPVVPAPPVPMDEEDPDVMQPEDIVPVAAGGDPDDSGDSSSDEEDSDSATDTDNDNGNNDDPEENNNGGEEGGDDQGQEPPAQRERTYAELLTSEHETGYFSRLLEEVLLELENTVPPMYITNRVIDPDFRDYYVTRVLIRERQEVARGYRTSSVHNSDVPHATYAASVSAAARRALWSLTHRFDPQLSGTDYRHLPRRLRGTERTFVRLGAPAERRTNLLARVVAALNNDLESVSTELVEVRNQLLAARDRIVQLEAREAPPQEAPQQEEEDDTIRCPAMSPSRQRLRYSEPGSSTRFHQ